MSGGNGAPAIIAAEMFIPSPGFGLMFTNAGEYYQLGGLSHGIDGAGIDIVGAVAEFTIKSDGLYKFDGVASLFPDAGMLIVFTVFKNGVAFPSIESSIDFKNSQAMQTFSGTGLLELVKGDVITVKGVSDTAGVTVHISNLNIHLYKK